MENNDSDSEGLPDDGAVEDEDGYSSDDLPHKQRPNADAAESLLHPDDIENFMKLSKALQLLLSGRITDEQIKEADTLLREYCAELVEVSASVHRLI